jgi:predicted ArsR family transcriptional regulator
MRDARRRIVDLLRVHGSLTVAELMQYMDVTRTAVVNHVGGLEREGLVMRSGVRPGKRRPSTTFTLTESANELFPQGYDSLAIALLDEIKRASPELAGRLTRRISQRWIDRDLPHIGSSSGRERLKRVVTILAKHGFMPKLHWSAHRFVLEQYNCPVKRAGAEHPEVCAMVARWIRALIGEPVQQVRCASADAGFCSYMPVRGKGR